MREQKLRESVETPRVASYFEWALLLVASSVFLGFGGLCLLVTLLLG
jgi:hypothetical protein